MSSSTEDGPGASNPFARKAAGFFSEKASSDTLLVRTMAELAREYECGEATIWRALQ
jgi:hypothetical protein